MSFLHAFHLRIRRIINSNLTFSGFSEKYRTIQNRPNLLNFVLTFCAILIKHKNLDICRNFIMEFKNCRLKAKPGFINDMVFPLIDILYVVEQKDFIFLENSVRNLLKYSLNPIKDFYFVVPSNQIKILTNILSTIFDELDINQIGWKIISEDDVVPKETREKLRENFGGRYGWVLQQFATVYFVFEGKFSKSERIFALDADTVITDYMCFVNIKNKQILCRTSEYNQPYYDLIRKLDQKLCKKRESFIAHQMLYQVSFFKDIFARLSITRLSDLVDFVIENFERSSNSPICIEFEIYAQGMRVFYSDYLEILKFSNVGISRANLRDEFKISEYEGVYNSISMHSYS